MKKILYLLVIVFAQASFAQTPQLVIPRGHSGDVSVTALSPDNKMLASGSWDKTVKLWDMENGKELKTFYNYPSWVKSLAFSPDGKLLVSGANKELRINDINLNGKEIFRKEIHADDIDAVAFSPDGKILITAGSAANKTTNVDMFELKFWNVANMMLLKKLQAKGGIETIRFENNNELLAIGRTQIVHINANTATVTSTEKFDDFVLEKLSPDGKWVIKTAFENSKVTMDIVDRKTKQSAKKFIVGPDAIKTIAFSPDGRSLVIGADGVLFIYDLVSMKLSGKITEKMSYPAGLLFTSDGSKLISGNYDRVIRIWNFEDRKFIKKLGGEANVILDLALAPNGQTLAVAGSPGYGGGGFIQVLDLKRGTVTLRYNTDNVGDIKYSPDGKYLVAGVFGKEIGLWNTAMPEKLKIFEGEEKATVFAISPDIKIMVSSNYRESIPKLIVWSFPEGKKLNSFTLPGSANSIIFSPDQRSIYVGLSNGDKICKIDVKSGKTLQTFHHESEYNSVTGIEELMLIKDGTVLLAGDYYSHVRWYNTATGNEIGNIDAQYGTSLNDMIMLPGSNEIITCAGESAFADSTINFTDINTRKNTRTFYGHSNAISALATDAAGRFLFSGGIDRTVRIWDMSKGKPVASLVFFGGTDWVIVDNAGRFDGTSEGMKKMYYVKGLETIPLESAYEQFYTPNLLPRILEGENFTPTPINIGTLKDAPKVKISAEEMQRNLSVDIDMAMYNATKEQVSIKVQADCPDDGVTEIRLFQNGKLVETTRNLVVEDEKAAEKSAIKTFVVNLSPGENRFKAIAFNTQRTESKPAELLVNYKPAANEQPVTSAATLHLIVVGVNSYKNPKYNLNYALADATAFSEAIISGSRDLFEKTNTIFIKDADATKEGMAAAFEKVKAAAKPQDLFVFYYAGHGVINDKNQFFLVPYDVTQLYGNDGALEQKGFSAVELQQMSKDIKAQKQLFILDACQSAGALNSVVSARGAAEEKAISQLARATGTYWLTASSSEQFASEFSQLGHGSFTYCLLEAFKGDANPGDKKLTVKILDAYLQTKVPEITQKYKGTVQYPVSYSYGNDFPIIMVK